MDSSLCHHLYFLDKPLRFDRAVLKGQPVLSGHLVIRQLRYPLNTVLAIKLNATFTTLRPRPNVELFMRRSKLSELSSSKVRRLAQLSWDPPTRSIRLLQTDRMSE